MIHWKSVELGNNESGAGLPRRVQESVLAGLLSAREVDILALGLGPKVLRYQEAGEKLNSRLLTHGAPRLPRLGRLFPLPAPPAIFNSASVVVSNDGRGGSPLTSGRVLFSGSTLSLREGEDPEGIGSSARRSSNEPPRLAPR